MTAGLATQSHAATTLAQRTNMAPEKLELIRNQVAPGAPDDVLELYFERCRLAGADPFARMFYASKRNVKDGNQWKERWTVESTIDGFRSIAESTGEYDGQDEPVYVYSAEGALVAAKVTVYRKGMSRGVTAVAFFDEFAQYNRDGELGPMWKKMPRGQLAKCAEALALRKAFPRQLSGVYTNDEMAQSENPADAKPAAAPRVQAEPTIRTEVQPRNVTPLPAPAAQPAASTQGMNRTALLTEVYRANGFGKTLTGAQMKQLLTDVASVLQNANGFASLKDISDDMLRAYLNRKRGAPETAEIPITDLTNRKLFALLGKAEFTTKEARIAFAKGEGVNVESYSDLTESQAQKLIGILEDAGLNAPAAGEAACEYCDRTDGTHAHGCPNEEPPETIEQTVQPAAGAEQTQPATDLFRRSVAEAISEAGLDPDALRLKITRATNGRTSEWDVNDRELTAAECAELLKLLRRP